MDAWVGQRGATRNEKLTFRHVTANSAPIEMMIAGYTTVPEESCFNTVLSNIPDLRLSQDIFRYVDWSVGGAHPKF
jgi:hypothetical protein